MKIRTILWKGLKKILFKLDAETAHRFAVLMIKLGTKFRSYPLIWISGSHSLNTIHSRSLEKKVCGIEFQSPLGLAAGFDKNAEILGSLPSLGFGFVEIGTVTPRPQAGNPRPRLFRDIARQSLFNRMGFNGIGAPLIAERLKQTRLQLPKNFRVGINLGKNKETSNEESASDYVLAAQPFLDLADYFVVNVSSPNTPGLRDLQSTEGLRPIVQALKDSLARRAKHVPLLLKLAPELSSETLAQIISDLDPLGVDGWVLTNTLSGEKKWGEAALPGGWSGGVLCERARWALTQARSLTRKPIISVGGILDVREAELRLKAGADLIQIYTGWIYQGPSFPVRILQHLGEVSANMDQAYRRRDAN